MSDKRDTIKIIKINSIILMVILVLGLIILHNTNYNSTDRNKNPVTTEISVDQSNGIFCSVLRLKVFQKICISDKDIFNLVTTKNSQILDNKKADQLIALIQTIRNRTENIQTSFFLYHLFPAERDEIPVLS